MKKILNITLAAAFACAMTGCQDFLDTSSPSVVDRDFVFSNEESARGALYYGYETLRANRSVHNVGFFWHPVWGSDIEDSQDIYDEGSAGICEKWYYPGGTGNYNINSGEGTEVFTKLYETISVANSLISSFEALDNFQSIMTGEPNNLSDIYGQAVALRATCYWELCRWYGDVPHALNAGEQAKGLTSRYAIYDYHIRKLREIEEKDRVRNFQPPVSGELIMETYGIPPCRIVGEIKDEIKEAILDGRIANDYGQAYAMMEELAARHGLKRRE